MATGRGSWRLEERKYQLYLQGQKEGRSGELLASLPHLSPWEADGANHPGKHFQTHEGQDGDLE